MATKVEAALIAAPPACPSSSPRPRGRRPRWPGSRSARCSPPRAGGRAPASSGCATPAGRAAGWCSTRAPCGRSASAARSLLAAGITGVAGDFLADDPVELVGPDGAVVARGLVAYDARELPGLLGRKTRDLPPEYRREVVHRDEMVLVGRGARRPVTAR